MKTRVSKRLEWHGVFLIFLVGLSIRLLLAQKNITFLDRQFIPDDTYYVLSLARSLVTSQQFSIGGQLTNGFQPLLVFILWIFAIFFHGLALLRADLVFLGIIDSFNILLIAVLAHQLFKKYASWIAALFWALSPLAISNFLSGLESALSLFFTLVTLNIWLIANKSNSSKKLYFLLGLSIGLTFLSRVDTAFLIIIIGLCILLSRKYTSLAIVVMGALLVILPWWGYEIIHFHRILPESGSAVKFLLTLHQQDDLTVTKAFAFGLASILFAPFFQSHLIQSIALQNSFIAFFISACFLLYLFLCFKKEYGDITSRKNNIIFNAILLYGVCIFAFYVFYLPALWFFRRYLEPDFFVMTILLAGAISATFDAYKNKYLASLYLMPFFLFISISVLTVYRYYASRPTHTIDKDYFGAKGYAEVAQDILSHVPSGATLGALQSGALSYFAGNRVRVINLDGVVNGAAAVALRNHRLANYAREEKIRYVADWKYNIGVFIKQSSASQPYFLNFVVDSKVSQGSTVFGLYKIIY